jgi:hypothetical protein
MSALAAKQIKLIPDAGALAAKQIKLIPDAGAEAAKQIKLIPDVPPGMQGGGDLAAKVETLRQDVAEILAIVRSIQDNPPYAMLA